MSLEKLRNWITIVLIAIVCFVYLGLIVAITFTEHKGIYYNCTMSEISPDFPKQVKEKCRG